MQIRALIWSFQKAQSFFFLSQTGCLSVRASLMLSFHQEPEWLTAGVSGPEIPLLLPNFTPTSLENRSGRLLRGLPIPGVQSESILPAAAIIFEKLTETTSSSAYNPTTHKLKYKLLSLGFKTERSPWEHIIPRRTQPWDSSALRKG